MNIIPFQCPDFAIRAVDIDGEPWFVGKDIAEALGNSMAVPVMRWIGQRIDAATNFESLEKVA